MNLTTLPRVKRRIQEVQEIATYDGLLADLIAEVSKLCEIHLGRPVQQTARTIYLDVRRGQDAFILGAWPVDTGSSYELRSNSESDFSDSGSIVASTDYLLDDQAGILYLTDHAPSIGPRTLRFTCTAGMATTDILFAAAYPDIAGAVDAEVVRRFKHRHRPDAVSVSDAGGSFSLVDGDALMQKTRDVLDYHRMEASCA